MIESMTESMSGRHGTAEESSAVRPSGDRLWRNRTPDQNDPMGEGR
jgi:hypothetical protein